MSLLEHADPRPSTERITASPLRTLSRAPYRKAIEELVTVVQKLSLARDLETVMSIVRVAARELTGADGATFVLRQDEHCFYAEENAISPLWKGRRFPMETCISGWVMIHREPALIEDIYKDARIPVDAYRPTFVRSLAMVPIRTLDPIGAIGNYWAKRHRPTAEQVRLLQALADTTAVALENVRVYAELEQRVRDRTAQLQVVNNELRAEVSERRKAEAEVWRLSMTDELTGLCNRRAFFSLAKEQLAQARGEDGSSSLIFADVDGLKQVNDEFGHDAGDDMLRDAAKLLKRGFRESDVVARLGGDEFAVLAATPEGSASEIQDRLQREADRFNRAGTRQYELSISVGVVPCISVDRLEEAVARADTAMYRHKRSKKDANLHMAE
jgi:diguanylate cyclase (GGDEF)-like protein